MIDCSLLIKTDLYPVERITTEVKISFVGSEWHCKAACTSGQLLSTGHIPLVEPYPTAANHSGRYSTYARQQRRVANSGPWKNFMFCFSCTNTIASHIEQDQGNVSSTPGVFVESYSGAVPLHPQWIDATSLSTSKLQSTGANGIQSCTKLCLLLQVRKKKRPSQMSASSMMSESLSSNRFSFSLSAKFIAALSAVHQTNACTVCV